MNLKKSDKIIAIVGVLVLIVAAIGVIVYVPEEGDEPTDTGDGELKKFNIVKDSDHGIDTTTNCPLNLPKKLSLFSKGKSYSNKEFYTLDAENVKSITIEVKYTDQQTPFLNKILKKQKIGMDVLTVNVVDPDGTKHSFSIDGNGKKNETIMVSPEIMQSCIEAKTIEEAQMEIANMSANNSKWYGECFEVSANLKVKGTLGPLARLAERFQQDQFSITISYDTYHYDLVEETPDDGNGENGDDDNNEESYNGTPYSGMSVMGFH